MSPPRSWLANVLLILIAACSHAAADSNDLTELRKAAEQGDPRSQTLYGVSFLEEKRSDPKALAEARQWIGKAAEQGYLPAQRAMSMLLISGIGGEKDIKGAEAWLKKAAEKGDGDAYLGLSELQSKGIGRPVDIQEGNRLLRIAAEHGSERAQYNLGAALYNGESMPADKVESLAWFLLSMLGGNDRAPDAVSEVSEQLNDEQVEAARKRAGELAKQIAKATGGSPVEIPMIVRSNVHIDEVIAAAEKGSLFAQRWLAQIYLDGKIVPQDLAKRAHWLLKAAEQGDPECQAMLSDAYYLGAGVPKDPVQCAAWARKAALQGNVKAQNNTGDNHENGAGVAKDLVEAHAWYALAAENGSELASEGLSSTRKVMTPEQLEKSGKRLAELRKEVAASRKPGK